jgi:hypothetical protein
MIRGLFDVYNLGTASTLREGMILPVKLERLKTLPRLGKEFS